MGTVQRECLFHLNLQEIIILMKNGKIKIYRK